MLKIIFTNRLTDVWFKKIESLRKEFPNVEFLTFREVEHPRTLLKEADAVVGGHFSSEEIESAQNLKIIFVPWTGVNMLPWDTIRKKGIIVTNTHSNSRTVAERAVVLSLALTGRIVEFHNDLQKGVWHGFPVGLPNDDYWTSIYGKTCAIIGLGNIGKHIAKMIKAFECHVVALKKHSTDELPDYVDELSLDLETVISKSDIVFVSLPLTPETKGMFNEQIFSKMKGKYIVNVSRGEIVEEKALYEALKNGTLAGAAIDTWYQYPAGAPHVTLPSSYPIHTFKNVVLSPHMAGVTRENMVTMANDTIATIRAYLKNGEIKNKVDPNLMY
jgi:phosphoglycerate dehydrogenase-like enzyme